MPDRTDINIRNFYIFNSTLSSKEEEERNKILFYYPPSIIIDEQLKNVGFSEAILKFAQTFSPDKPCETIRTKKTRQFYLQPEENFWMVMTLNLPAIKPKEIADEAEYLEHDVQDAVYLAALKLAYDMAKMFVGTFSSSVEGKKTKQLKIKLEKFYFRYLTTLKINNLDIMALFQGVQYLPLDPLRFLHIQSSSNLLEAEFPEVESSIILYDNYLVWSGIDYSEMQLISLYVRSLQESSHLDAESENLGRNSARTTNVCRFLTGPKNFLDEDASFESVPVIYLHSSESPTKYYLNVYEAINFTVCMLINEKERLTVELFKKLDKFLGDKLLSLSSKIKSVAPTFQSLQAPMEKFLYFNKLNLAVKTLTAQSKSSLSIPEEVMRVVTDIAVHNRRCCKLSASAETVVKLMKLSDYWVVGKMSDDRECYFILQAKNAALSYIHEEANKMCNLCLKSIFVHK
ncbi:unnamed protein product [Bemisia tabaci]|uniref:Vacuolar fusion protein CCZ1 homolog n=1 Tax=Bemisia tabaci TaxID=7038 RepID=A0A9P0G2J2_BEMTA|nr:unnamed protein product [Bemisia tabaci]